MKLQSLKKYLKNDHNYKSFKSRLDFAQNLSIFKKNKFIK